MFLGAARKGPARHPSSSPTLLQRFSAGLEQNAAPSRFFHSRAQALQASRFKVLGSLGCLLVGLCHSTRGVHTKLGRARGSAAKTRRSCQDVQAAKCLPKCVVFDLDGCLWYPEMYELSWDRGGAPFSRDSAGTIHDRRGCPVRLHSGVDAALTELATDANLNGVVVAVASCCDVPPWAYELLGKFEFGPDKARLASIIKVRQIHKGSKQTHFREISEVVGCRFDEMIFFDNEKYNCDQVAQLGSVLSCCLGSQQLFDEDA